MVKQTPSKKKAHKKVAASSNVNAKQEITQSAVTSTTKAAKASKSMPADPVGKLAKWYKWSGIVLLLASAAVAFVSKAMAAPITVQYPSIDSLASDANGHQVLSLASRHIADVQLGWVVVTFLAVFGVINLMLATMYRPYLEPSLKRGVNAFRWLSLGLGGGLMVVTVAMITGFSSLALLLTLFVATLVGSMLALAAETVVANNDGTRTRFARFMYCSAVTISAVPWGVFALSLLGALLWNGHFAPYMYSIYACQFALFCAIFGATKFRLKRQGKWADALYTDRSFMALTFIAAMVLAVQVFVGVLR